MGESGGKRVCMKVYEYEGEHIYRNGKEDTEADHK